ncbi:hypothetical protein GQ44DRAFT_726083 [Phaeosphaeriaceae sp. PMI808]|nr:hypothetical protein GQ44DRAFT_726083 [Phaeosphaeriaceae sp. PMI808]
MTDKDDVEWEFEYESTETEDFYIPLDLSNVPSSQVPTNPERRPGHPTLLKSRLRALNATRGQGLDTTIETPNAREAATIGEIQISGLHTKNPLIMYNDQLLSCHWTSAIGTDMLFSKPRDRSDSPQPLRSLPSVDLMALGTAKLIAKVGRLRPHDETIVVERAAQPTSVGVGQDASAPAIENQQSTTRLPQTNFLTKLNEAKSRRGEMSRAAIARISAEHRLVSEPITHSGEDGPSRLTGHTPMSST